MQITESWLQSIKDDQGHTAGQLKLLQIWKTRQAFVGYDYLPDQVAHVIETCKGYRGIPPNVKEMLQ